MALTTTEMRKAWKSYEAAPSKMEHTSFGGVSCLVAPESKETWQALDAVLTAHGYQVRAGDTGTYADRDIAGTSSKSLHAYGVALDLNWDTNPVNYKPKSPVRFSAKATQAERAQDVRNGVADTDMTRQMIDDILAIRTNAGIRPLEWGNWKTKIDTMHFEIDASPADLAAGINWATVRKDGRVQPAVGLVEVAGFTAEPPPAPWTDAFIKAHVLIEKWEGNFSNHPSDPGGATKFGITQATLSAWRGHPVSIEDVRSLTREEARRIFYTRYWRPMRLDDVPYPAALMTYNCGVNSGPQRGGLFLQRALNRQGAGLTEDGAIGARTVAAADAAAQLRLVTDFSAIYEEFYRSLSTWPVFGKGWMSRLNEITAAAKAASGGAPAPVSLLDNPGANAAGPAGDTAIPPAASSTIVTKEEPPMTAIDVALGGKYLLGKKTLIAGAAFAALMVLHKISVLTIDDKTYDMLVQLIATYGGLSALSKVERTNAELSSAG